MRIIFVLFMMFRRFWLVLTSSFIPSRYTGLSTTTYLNAITYFLIITISSLLISSVGNFVPGFLQTDELETIPDFEIIDGKFMLIGGLKEPYWIDNSSVIEWHDHIGKLNVQEDHIKLIPQGGVDTGLAKWYRVGP